MRRACGIVFGLVVHAVFGVTVWVLYGFLHGTRPAPVGSLWLDVLACLQFAVVHSVILLPRVRRSLEPLIGATFYSGFFCLATCLGLGTMIALWRASPIELWHATGFGRVVVDVGFFGSWGLLFYSLSLNGLGYQTGFTPWWHWLRRTPAPPRRFVERGAYRVMRHPVYFSFLGLIWCTPVMTLDHAVLTGVLTVYIFIGSSLKDRRLVYYMGDRYRDYQARVPGFPGMIAGPLARIAPRQPSAAAGGQILVQRARYNDSSP